MVGCVSVCRPYEASVFETTIRVVGGMLAAFELTNDRMFVVRSAPRIPTFSPCRAHFTGLLLLLFVSCCEEMQLEHAYALVSSRVGPFDTERGNARAWVPPPLFGQADMLGWVPSASEHSLCAATCRTILMKTDVDVYVSD